MRWQTVHPYLSLMGITPWRLRKPLANAVPTLVYHRYALTGARGIPCGGLLLEDTENAPGEQEKVTALLNAMLKAIRVRHRFALTSAPLPSMYLVMGEALGQAVLQSPLSLEALRGQVHYQDEGAIPVVVTYHPLHLLRQPADKRKAWQDLQLAAKLGTRCQ